MFNEMFLVQLQCARYLYENILMCTLVGIQEKTRHQKKQNVIILTTETWFEEKH